MVIQSQLMPQPLDSSLGRVSHVWQEVAVLVFGPVGDVVVAAHGDPLRFLVFAACYLVAESLA
jgi:broad specificity phosphatase PhoE